MIESPQDNQRDSLTVPRVVDAIDDPVARRILSNLVEPKTAQELSEELTIPLTTVYRKVNDLVDASLVAERLNVRLHRNNTNTYQCDFDEIVVTVDEDGEMAVTVVGNSGLRNRG